MVNELLEYVAGGIVLVSAVTFVVSSYNLNKKIKQSYKRASQEYKEQQKAKANELENILVSIPEEQRQKTVTAISIITNDYGLHLTYIAPILQKYSQA